jgi:hypothetical protein
VRWFEVEWFLLLIFNGNYTDHHLVALWLSALETGSPGGQFHHYLMDSFRLLTAPGVVHGIAFAVRLRENSLGNCGEHNETKLCCRAGDDWNHLVGRMSRARSRIEVGRP